LSTYEDNLATLSVDAQLEEYTVENVGDDNVDTRHGSTFG